MWLLRSLLFVVVDVDVDVVVVVRVGVVSVVLSLWVRLWFQSAFMM